ncbi:adenosylcobinamide-GDP ribazoletransferase [Nocardioidaceae bacterium]|nr:adenosylcobinamide-GDP ribazoletransferase [Nocardioidaceae bacterium]
MSAAGLVRRELGGVRDAATLLTRVPVGGGAGRPEVAATWFPLVGAAVGIVVASVLVLASTVLSAFEAAVLAVVVEVLLTGALHLDGLADTADGTAGRDPEHRLRIMRDHAIGVYGALAVGLDLALRVAVLAGLVVVGLPAPSVVVLVAAAYALSRWSLLHAALVLGYPREAGTGQGLVEGLTAGRSRAATGVLLVLLLAAGAVLGLPGLVILAWSWVMARAVSVLVAAWARLRLGGITGDVLGACVELTLAVVLVVAAALLRGAF